MAKKCENIITFINESLYVHYLKSTWWIDSGALFMLLNPYRDSVRRGLRKEEKDTLKLQMESEQMLKPLVIFL